MIAHMDRRLLLGVARAGFALLVLLASVVQVNTSIGQGTFDPTKFFAFFTILSNSFGLVLFLVLAARWRSGGSVTTDLCAEHLWSI
jgi:hypothetical protein